ncbi:phospholipid/cholesterol/gamma-HCH transport system substrate-binding protein [Thermomonospora echinospora]|uniref:Phospholipid/cholesterol/gamma-HCH transport system substrate-binding protein n=1 Tax=Thermomonospora echinospora TaxID=1992 RepID=A0A1H6D825_9ACTN|nr:MCE family protein [Thermomonospora echinospora]SEG81450.1 phospholipid/cholesterol/gamma-HCH transport system substrate-binding protein [Thermomonospora echinospora]
MARSQFQNARSSAVQVVAFLALTGTLTFFIAAQIARLGFGDTYRLVAVFSDVSGLRKGDKVKIAGAPVGQVGQIRVRAGRAEVELRVGTGHRVPRDSEAAIRWRDAISQRVVYLIPGTDPAMLHDGDRVARTRAVVDIGDLINRLEPLARGLEPAQVNTILTAVYTALDGTEADASRLLADIDDLSSTIAGRRQTFKTMLDNFSTVTGVLARRDAQIAAATDDLATLTMAFNDNSALVDEAIDELAATLRTTDLVAGDNADELNAMLDRLTVVLGGTRRNLSTVQDIVTTIGPKFQDMFHMFDRGEFVTGALVCMNTGPGPCPYPMRLTKVPEQRTLTDLVVGGG